ncbi:hypothetical protein [Kribbella sp. VKM Ac-2568]|uniref:hypothetical protein n=1 Tax=Kribbella sp. VKM Ac-2568 TaxID=2512219 RepID=UPI00104CB361|nr:hypothetical protein [Kribbella sp. VKM Ac-2568]
MGTRWAMRVLTLNVQNDGHGTVIATRWPHRVVEVVEHRGDPHWWTWPLLWRFPAAATSCS